MAINFNNTTYPPGFLGIDDGGVPATGTFQVDAPSTYTVRVTGTVNQAGDTVRMTYGADAPTGFANSVVTLTASNLDNSSQILFTSTSVPPARRKPARTATSCPTRRSMAARPRPDRSAPASPPTPTAPSTATTWRRCPASSPAR